MIVYFSYRYDSGFAHLHNHRMVERCECNSYLLVLAREIMFLTALRPLWKNARHGYIYYRPSHDRF